MIRLLSIGVAATLNIAGLFAPAVTAPAEAAEGLTLSHEAMDRVMKIKRGSKKPGAAKLTSGQRKVGTSDGKYINRKLPGRAK
jgi:hypothetical protein